VETRIESSSANKPRSLKNLHYQEEGKDRENEEDAESEGRICLLTGGDLGVDNRLLGETKTLWGPSKRSKKRVDLREKIEGERSKKHQ